MNDIQPGSSSQPELRPYEPELESQPAVASELPSELPSELQTAPMPTINKLNLLMVFIWAAVLVVGIFALLTKDQNGGLSTTNPSSQTTANNSSVNPASLITPSASPTPLGGAQTPAPSAGSQSTAVQLLSSDGGSGSKSGGGSSSSTTSLTTDNSYNYYTTLANGQLAAVNPTPTPIPGASATPTPHPTSTPAVLGSTSPTNYFADDVIGADDLISAPGGNSSTRFNTPVRMALDTVHHRLFINDQSGNRVLVFNLNSSNNLIDKTADFVIGQGSFTSGAGCNGAWSASCMDSPIGLAYDSANDRLFVSDAGNNRVLLFNTAALSTGMSASAVLGQSSFSGHQVNQGGVTSQSGLSTVAGLTYDTTRHLLFIADISNNRVIIQNVGTSTSLPGGNGQNAANVLGQPDFTSNASALTQSGMFSIRDVAYDSTNQRLFVSDIGNSRVLVFNLTSITNGQNAVNVLGQTNFTSNTQALTQSGLGSNVQGIAYDSTHNTLYVSDLGANRVMIYDVAPGTIANGENAKGVIGQTSYTSNGFGTSSSLIHNPNGIVYDTGNDRLYLADQSNSRVLIYNSVSVGAPVATSFVFAGSSSQTAGVYAPISATLHDVNGNVINAAADTTIALTTNIATGVFYPTVTGGTPITSITITAGNSTATFYFRATQVGSGNVTGNSSGFATVNFADTITADAASVAVLTPATQTVTANSPSSVITLTTKDSFGNAVNVATNKTFNLSDAASGQFSVLSSPFTPVSTATVGSGTSSTTFYYKASVPGTYTITASLSGFTSGTAVMTVNQATITQYYYNVAPASGAAGAASTVFTVGAKDTNGNVVVLAANQNVYLYSSGSGGTFSITAGGTYTSALTIVINAGSTTANYFYKNNSTAGSPYTLTASDNSSAPDGATGIADATTSYAVSAGTATVATLAPASQTVTAGSASSVITVTTKDSLGNPANVGSNTAFALSSTGTGGQFATDSGFTNIVSSVTVNSGTSSTTFYYRNNTSGGYTLTATATSGFTPAPTTSVTVNAAAIASYYYATAPATGAAGASSSVFTVGAHDAFGNVVTVASNTTVYLYSSAPAGTFSNSGSGGPFTATTATIPTGNTTTDFYYKNNSTSGSPYTLTASDNASAPDGATGVVDATTSYSVTSGAAVSATLAPSSQSVTAGSPSSVITLTTKDSLGNPTPVGANTTFTLSDGGNGGTFSNSGSGGPYTASSVTVNSGNSSATFYYQNTTTGVYTITTHNAGFSPDATTSITVGTGTIASYYFVSAGSSANINVASSAFVVGAHDVFGNVVTVASNTTVYLYSTSGTGTFSNTTDSGPYTATTATITTGNTTATFYYKDSAAGNVTIVAADQTPTYTPDTGATNATSAFTVFNPDVKVGPNVPITDKTATLNDSRPGDPDVAFSWVSSHANTIKAIRLQVCTVGLKNTACTVPTDADLSLATLASTGGELGASGWSITSVISDHEILITNSTGATTTVGGTSSFNLAGFVNPTSIGTFFFRISTYTTVAAAPGDSVSFGTFGASTNRSLTPTADVAESLVFRVANAVASDCTSQTDVADPNDAASDLVVLTPRSMTAATTSIGTAQFCATANAGNGYTISYYDAALGGATKGFWNGSHEFAVANQFTSTQGSEQFGFNLRSNTTPSVGFDPDGNGLVADLTNADYATVNRFSYNDTGTSTILAQKSAPNAATARYTLSYVANVSATTQGGTYKAHQVFVLTATY